VTENPQTRIARRFPRLYHYSPLINRGQIERFRAVFCAELIRTLAPTPPALGRREKRQPVETALGSFTLNDQAALNWGNVKHPRSLGEAAFIELLDQFAFFWPGDHKGPIKMGRNFVGRYINRGDALLQVTIPTEAFLQANASVRLFVSTCNSGATRSNQKALIYRGTETFVPLGAFAGPTSKIKEVAVLGFARLPVCQISCLTGAAQQ
jgi:hypothetical protein